MSINKRVLWISPETKELREKAKQLYRKHHPELNHIVLSEDKFEYEFMKFYLEAW